MKMMVIIDYTLHGIISTYYTYTYIRIYIYGYTRKMVILKYVLCIRTYVHMYTCIKGEIWRGANTYIRMHLCTFMEVIKANNHQSQGKYY